MMTDSRQVTIKLRIELPENHILTTEHSSKLTWELLDTHGEAVSQGTHEFQHLEPVVWLQVPNTQVSVRIKLWVYFCDIADVACILERRTVDVVNLGPAVAEGSLTLPIKITEAAQV